MGPIPHPDADQILDNLIADLDDLAPGDDDPAEDDQPVAHNSTRAAAVFALHGVTSVIKALAALSVGIAGDLDAPRLIVAWILMLASPLGGVAGVSYLTALGAVVMTDIFRRVLYQKP